MLPTPTLAGSSRITQPTNDDFCRTIMQSQKHWMDWIGRQDEKVKGEKVGGEVEASLSDRILKKGIESDCL